MKHTIGKITPAGASSLFFTGPDATSAFNAIRFDSSASMFIGDYINHRVYKKTGTTTSIHCQFPVVTGLPNDLAVAANGQIYASSMDYGAATGETWLCNVDGTSKKAVNEAWKRGNGIALSPTDDKLYVSSSDSTSNMVYVFDRSSNGELSNKQLFFDFSTMGSATIDIDGMRCDSAGNLYVTRNGGGAVVKLNPSGEVVKTYLTTFAAVTNLEFGGSDGKTLYVVGRCSGGYGTGDGCVNAISVEEPGRAWVINSGKFSGNTTVAPRVTSGAFRSACTLVGAVAVVLLA